MRRLFCLLTLLAFLGCSIAIGVTDPLAGYPPIYQETIKEAMRAFWVRDFDKVKSLMDKADKMYPRSPMALNIRGAIAIEQKRFDEGRNYCLEALKDDPNFYPAQFNLCEIPFVQRKWAEARQEFEKLQETHKNDDLIGFRILITYLMEKNEKVAKERVDAIPFLSDSPIYYYSQAAWEFAHGNEKQGVDWVKRGDWVFPPVKTRPYADVFYDLGWLKRPSLDGGTAPVVPAVEPPLSDNPLKLQVQDPDKAMVPGPR